jgi:very-short-patch-repair endonuclease
LQNPSFCEEKSDTTVYYINRYINAMQTRGIKFDKTPEDKAMFLQFQEEGETERTITQPTKEEIQHVEPSSDSCPTCETEPVLGLHECALCHLSTSTAIESEGHFFCSQAHADRAKAQGLFKPQPMPEVKVWKPKETWTQRQAVMHPQHSRIEEALLLKLEENGFHPITDREFPVASTTPDFFFPDKNVCFYIDGQVHEGKEERDDKIRGLLTSRYGIRVVAIAYSDFTKEETERIFAEIMEVLK